MKCPKCRVYAVCIIRPGQRVCLNCRWTRPVEWAIDWADIAKGPGPWAPDWTAIEHGERRDN